MQPQHVQTRRRATHIRRRRDESRRNRRRRWRRICVCASGKRRRLRMRPFQDYRSTQTNDQMMRQCRQGIEREEEQVLHDDRGFR